MLARLASGVASVIVPADKLEFNPPPLACVGGVSSVVPRTVTGPPLVATTTSADVIGRRSAVPAGDENVVMSTMRKRSRVTDCPVVFVNLRRMSSVPLVEVAPGPGVKSRTRFGGLPTAAAGSIKLALIVALRWIGLDRFSGPGAPSR